jgi:hypothetical protein
MVHVMGALCNVCYWDSDWVQLKGLTIKHTTVEHAAALLSHFQKFGAAFVDPDHSSVAISAAIITVEMEVLRGKST